MHVTAAINQKKCQIQTDQTHTCQRIHTPTRTYAYTHTHLRTHPRRPVEIVSSRDVIGG